MNPSEMICPVCYMTVKKGGFALDHEGLAYAFCSMQCRERFVANPHLYVGRPGQPAMKQQGREVIKRRTLRLQNSLSPGQASRLTEELQGLMGVRSVTVAGAYIDIRYDLLQVTAEQIERKIKAIGEVLSRALGEKLRRALIHSLEEIELDNLETQTDDGHNHHH